MILLIGLLLLAMLVLSAVVNGMQDSLSQSIPGLARFWQIMDVVVSLIIVTLLIGLIFKYLPDMRIGWRNVWFGASVTALLFVIGKFAIGMYLGHVSVGSAYGAAGSLVVLLVWVYYWR